MSNWNTSNYLQRKAQRLAQVKPEWIINPSTGEEFYLRRVGGLASSLLAGFLPSGLSAQVIETWKKKGVEGIMASDNVVELASSLTHEQQAAGMEETKHIAAIVQQMCVIPFLSNQPPKEIEFTKEWIELAIKGSKEKDPHFDAGTFDPKDFVFDPLKLDDEDAKFLFQFARGFADGVSMKGGNVISTANFSRLPRKPSRGTRASQNKPAIQQVS